MRQTTTGRFKGVAIAGAVAMVVSCGSGKGPADEDGDTAGGKGDCLIGFLCDDDEGGEPVECKDFSDPDRLMATLVDQAAFGEKRAGTAEGFAAADQIAQRLKTAGVPEVRFEEFAFPFHHVTKRSLAVGIDGAPAAVADDRYLVFEASGAGSLQGAEIVWVRDAKDDDIERALDGREDLSGVIALVRRDNKFHRSAQYRNLIEHKAAAMLYISAAEFDLLQTGSVRETWEAKGPIPALSIDKTFGNEIVDAIEGGKDVRADIDVQINVDSGKGRNVVGVIPGREAGQVIVGGHYDTWHAGSVDNGAAIAAMISLAEQWGRRLADGRTPRYDLVFVAYDGEELALYGGYDYLRKHQDEHAEKPIMSILNLEVPSAEDAGFFRGMASNDNETLDDILKDVGLTGGRFASYPAFVSLDFVNSKLGIIATDIQGFYRSGFNTASTAVDSEFYHTIEDTPDKVDVKFLAGVVDEFDCAIQEIMTKAPAELDHFDPHLWKADVKHEGGQAFSLRITDADATPQAGAWVKATMFCNDFFMVSELRVTTDADGRAQILFPEVDTTTLDFPAERVGNCTEGRYMQIESGKDYPLVEIAKAF